MPVASLTGRASRVKRYYGDLVDRKRGLRAGDKSTIVVPGE